MPSQPPEASVVPSAVNATEATMVVWPCRQARALRGAGPSGTPGSAAGLSAAASSAAAARMVKSPFAPMAPPGKGGNPRRGIPGTAARGKTCSPGPYNRPGNPASQRKERPAMPAAVRLSCLSALLAAVGCAAPAEGPRAEKGGPEPPAVRKAECRRRVGEVRIDGKADEAAWQKAEVLQDFAVFWQNRKPKTATRARLLWDDTHLYFTAEMEDN